MAVQPGNASRLNIVKGCVQLLEVDSSDTSLLDKVLPANILLKDSTTGGLYLTDGLHNLSYIFANNELLSDREMTAAEVTNIANQILYTENE